MLYFAPNLLWSEKVINRCQRREEEIGSTAFDGWLEKVYSVHMVGGVSPTAR